MIGRAYTVEDIMERWSLKTRKTAIALMTENPELHAYQIKGTWYVEEKYLQKFVENLCKTGGTSRHSSAGMGMVTSFSNLYDDDVDNDWAYEHMQKIGLTEAEIKAIIQLERG